MDKMEESPNLEPPEGDMLHGLLDMIETARNDFFVAASEYVRKPVEANSNQAVKGANHIAIAMYNFTQFILLDPSTPNERRNDIIASMFVNESEARVTYLNGLLSKDSKELFTPTPGDEQDIIQTINDAIDEEDPPEAILASLIGTFGHNLAEDINTLFEHGANGTHAKLLKTARSVGRHSLDVFKTGTAVAIGMILANEWNRQRS